MENIDFKEVQRFKVWWAWALVTALNLLFIFAILQQVIFGKPFGNKPASDLTLVLIELVSLFLFVFLLSIKLVTRIDHSGIQYRFYPFQFRPTKIEWADLRDAYMRQYNSFHEYGGWGLRTGSPKTGRAINTSESSNKGLQLVFKDGKQLLIGTKRPGEIEKFITIIMAKGSINREI